MVDPEGMIDLDLPAFLIIFLREGQRCGLNVVFSYAIRGGGGESQ